tara:strand:+ start:304 stop:1197 length:894 start_codon:yes stop_codon:yes gene_type:complete
MNLNSKISIIINCYNGSKYLRETLKSIQFQTFKNFEVIFWDNSSTDNSKEIFKSIKDKRFKYYYSTKKTSLYKGRNSAIKKAKGKYLSFIDTDDIWTKDKLKIQHHYIENNFVDIVYSNLWIFKDSIKNKKLYLNNFLESDNIKTSILEKSSVTLLTSLIKKKIFNKYKNPFNTKFNHIGDLDFFFKISKNYKFKFINKPMAYYRLHDLNLSKTKRSDEVKELKSWINANKKSINKFDILKLKKRIKRIQFIDFKKNNKILECLKLIFFSDLFHVKFSDLIVLVLPRLILKKILWWY